MTTEFKQVPTSPEPITIMAIVAHHDDIEFGISGSIAKWVEEGAQVTYVIITDGGAGSNEVGVIRAELVERRRQEQILAAQAVGVSDVRFLGYKDGELQPTLDLRRDLTRLIREIKPYRVILQDPTTVYFGENYINHPDHRAAGEAATYAVFPSAESRPIFAELLDEGYEPHHVSELFINLTLAPTHFVDISGTIEKKLASLRAHVSQIGAGEEAETGALGWIRERNAESGAQVGVGYAEMFRVMDFSRPRNEEEAQRQREAHQSVQNQEN
jgi:LmbE family N-acetylglucosaminyl deacetylase